MRVIRRVSGRATVWRPAAVTLTRRRGDSRSQEALGGMDHASGFDAGQRLALFERAVSSAMAHVFHGVDPATFLLLGSVLLAVAAVVIGRRPDERDPDGRGR